MRKIIFIVLIFFYTEVISDNAPVNLPLKELQMYSEVFSKIKEAHVDSVNSESLINGSIQGMLSSLNTGSMLLSEKDFLLEDGSKVKYESFGSYNIGIDYRRKNKNIEIIKIYKDSDAEKKGLKLNEIITHINGDPVSNITTKEIDELLEGEKESTLSLITSKDKFTKTTIIRDVEVVRKLERKLLNENYGYIKSNRISTRESIALRTGIESLFFESNGSLENLILDIRDNTGGVLSAAIDVADLFLDSELILSTEGRIADSSAEYYATSTHRDPLKGLPLILLVNSETASGAEIIAGALQDNGRALVVGEKTQGMGIVHTVLPIDEINAVKIATSRLFTPSGNPIEKQGILPDILFTSMKDKEQLDEVVKIIKNL